LIPYEKEREVDFRTFFDKKEAQAIHLFSFLFAAGEGEDAQILDQMSPSFEGRGAEARKYSWIGAKRASRHCSNQGCGSPQERVVKHDCSFTLAIQDLIQKTYGML